MYTWKESADMCQPGACKWHAYDMDGAYCTHKKSFAASHGFGLSTNAMIAKGLCTGCDSDPAKNKRELFEPVEPVETVTR